MLEILHSEGEMNQYLSGLCKIEFVVTDACTGSCKHCSEGKRGTRVEKIDAILAAEAVRKIVEEYKITTVMTFGGEPLLHTDAVYSIIGMARDLNVPRRQVITNGYFSTNPNKIRDVACRLLYCGVNDLLLSVDAFHQESIPIETVMLFARALKEQGVPTRLSPAWLVSREDDNPYNRKTKEIIQRLVNLGIPEGQGNIVFPAGNALEYLGEYFLESSPQNPYIEDPCNVKCISFAATGDVLDGNIYKNDIMEIIESYVP